MTYRYVPDFLMFVAQYSAYTSAPSPAKSPAAIIAPLRSTATSSVRPTVNAGLLLGFSAKLPSPSASR
jgi:hypothetical protein